MMLQQRTIHEIGLLWPDVLPVLQARGIDTCCGGMHSLQDAVAAHGQVLAEVVAELHAAGAVDPDSAPTVIALREAPETDAR